MKGTSKVILGATLVMVISLAIVLGLVLVLLAELYCSLLRRRRHLKPNSTATTTATTTATVQVEESSSSRSPLSSFYSHGVLQAPRNFLYPRVMMIPSDIKEGNERDVEKQQQHGKKLHQLLNFQTIGLGANESTNNSESVHHHRTTESGDVDLEVEGSPSPSYIMNSLPPHHHQSWLKTGLEEENVVYISNPIYDNSSSSYNDGVVEEFGKLLLLPRWSVVKDEKEEDSPPYETPETSPTRVDTTDKEAEEKIRSEMLLTVTTVKTPPLSPIKNLPAKAAVSVALRDARCVGTSGSESNSNSQNAGTGTYSTSSGSPRTSPSW